MSTTTYSSNNVLNAVAAAAKVLDERKEEVNRLNVFPVPDGDTGTNMSLTIQSVVSNVANLPIGALGADIRKAITTGALMGARGNSGVITSQILRGLCEGSQSFDEFDVESIAASFDRAREVAFQAVRKPVEGTILTVLRDSAAAAKVAVEQELSIPEALDAIVAEANSQASHLKQKAEQEIAQEKKQMLQDVRGEISDIAVSIASKVVEREVKKQDYDGFVDEFIKNVGEQQ